MTEMQIEQRVSNFLGTMPFLWLSVPFLPPLRSQSRLAETKCVNTQRYSKNSRRAT